eukprot:6747_1
MNTHSKRHHQSADFMDALIQLTSMGYDENTSRLVLTKYKNDINAAIEYFNIMSSTNQSHKSHKFTPQKYQNTNTSHSKHSIKHKHQNIQDTYPYSHTVSVSDLRAGDHIYCWRKWNIYSHHGIYIGNTEVIHFSGEIINAKDAKIIKTSLKQFLKGDTLKRVVYGVSKKYFKIARAGSCNELKPDHRNTIIKRAKSKLGSCKGTYNLYAWNCETFCLWCTLGQRNEHSNQATSGYIIATAAMGATAGGMIAGPAGAVIGGAVFYTAAVMEKKHEKKINMEKKNKVKYDHEKKKNVVSHHKKHTQQGYLDSDKLSELIKMGFDSKMAARALEVYKNDLNAAVQCLLADLS